MNFTAQTLAPAAHDDVGKVTVPNVTVDRSLADPQSLRSLNNRQKFSRYHSRQSISFSPE
jgi:hypothetical protein